MQQLLSRDTASAGCCSSCTRRAQPNFSSDSALLRGRWTRRSLALAVLSALLLLATFVTLLELDAATARIRAVIFATALIAGSWPVAVLVDTSLLHWSPVAAVRSGCCARHAASWVATGHGPLAVMVWAGACMVIVDLALQSALPEYDFAGIFNTAVYILVLAALIVVRRVVVRLSVQRVARGATMENLETLVHIRDTLGALFLPPQAEAPPPDVTLDDLVDMDLTHQLRWAESAQLVVAAPPGMAKGGGPKRSFWPLHMAPHVTQSTPPTPCEEETHVAAYPTIHLASRSQAARAAKALFPILFSQVATCTPPPPGAVAPAPDVDGVDSGATRLRQRGSGDTRSPSPPETRTASVMVEAVVMPARQPGRALGLEHLETVLGHEEAGALLSRLDVSGDSRVSLAEFTEGIAGMWDSFATAQATLAGRTTVSSAVSILVDAALIFVAVVFLFIVYQLDVSAVLLPLSAVLLAVSFAIGPSVSRLVASLTFVLGVRPFDVGERIILQNVLNGGKLDVLAVGVMSCTFKFAETGAHVTIGNDVLSTMPVQNLSRTATTTVLLPCKVPSNITSAQLAALERWLQEHCRQYSVHWGPAPKVYVLGLSHGLDGTVDIMLYLQYQRPPAQSARLAVARSQMWMALSEKFSSWGFVFQRPVQPVAMSDGGWAGGQAPHLHHTDGTTAHAAVPSVDVV